MKLLIGALTGLSCFLGQVALATDSPRGSLLELHSCELYAGGCIVSSEATLGGRYMLRAWHFTDGSFDGTKLAGLSLAVLQASSDNLAASAANTGSVMVYLPEGTTPVQRQALLGWVHASQPDLRSNPLLHTRVVPVDFTTTPTGYALSAGSFVSVQTAPLESCRTGACGDALWYTPRAPNSVFTVAMDRSSKVEEPLLELKWMDAGRRTVFLGKFGENTPAQNLYVSTSELCNSGSRLFN